MHEHVGKRAKMRRIEESQTGGIKQARQAYQHYTEWRKVCIKHINTTEVYLTSGYTLLGHEGDGCNHIRTNQWGTQTMAKPRSREANIDKKHRSKQAIIDI